MIKSMMLVAMMSVSTAMMAATASKGAVKNDKHMVPVTAPAGHGHFMATPAPMPAPGHHVAPMPPKPAPTPYVCRCHECKKHERMMAHHPHKANKHYECKCHECMARKHAHMHHNHHNHR